jgi:hypothetical protein
MKLIPRSFLPTYCLHVGGGNKSHNGCLAPLYDRGFFFPQICGCEGLAQISQNLAIFSPKNLQNFLLPQGENSLKIFLLLMTIPNQQQSSNRKSFTKVPQKYRNFS